MNIRRDIDHIVYSVKDLDAACNDLEKRLGVRPVFGGYHRTQGTKNALLHLGGQTYLELLAIDESNTKIEAPRWMGIDLIDRPQITRWALKSSNLESDSSCLKSYDTKLGEIHGGQRKMTDGGLLTWRLVMPTCEPSVDVLPFMVDWQGSSHHPTDKLLKGCQLVGLKISHPEAEKIEHVLQGLGVNLKIEEAKVAGIKIVVKSSNGRVIKLQ
ncbi:MAG: VOC family protein [Chitinophagales bacterium]